MNNDEHSFIKPIVLHDFMSLRMFHISYTNIDLRKLTLWHEHGLIAQPFQKLDKRLFDFYELIWIRMVVLMEEAELNAEQIRAAREALSFVPDVEHFAPTSNVLERLILLASYRVMEIYFIVTKDIKWMVELDEKKIPKNPLLVIPIYQLSEQEMYAPQLFQSFEDYMTPHLNVEGSSERFLQPKTPSRNFLNDRIEELQKRGMPNVEQLRKIKDYETCSDEEAEKVLHSISCFTQALYHFLVLRKKKGFLGKS